MKMKYNRYKVTESLKEKFDIIEKADINDIAPTDLKIVLGILLIDRKDYRRGKKREYIKSERRNVRVYFQCRYNGDYEIKSKYHPRITYEMYRDMLDDLNKAYYDDDLIQSYFYRK